MKIKRGNIYGFTIERLKELRRPLPRDSYDRQVFTEAIQALQEKIDAHDVGWLENLWRMDDPRV